MLAQKIYHKHNCGVSEVIRHLILGWLVAATLEYLFLPQSYRNLASMEGLKAMSFVRVLGFALGIALLFTCLSRVVGTQKAERWGVAAAFAIYTAAALSATPSWPLLGACTLVLGVLVVYAVLGWNGTPEPAPEHKPSGKGWLLFTIGLSLAFFLFVCAWTV